MRYGKPPVEVYTQLQGADPGDLQGHEVYPTYFYEIPFFFSPNYTTATYDTAEAARMPGGSSGPSSTPGGTYYRQFVIDTSGWTRTTRFTSTSTARPLVDADSLRWRS
jgi:hypothetical protein